MNPSGDYGKKELSYSLRSRFTEIYFNSPFDLTIYNETEIKNFL